MDAPIGKSKPFWRRRQARGEAAAIEAQAAASAKAVAVLAEAMRADGGQEACALRVAEQYVSAFKGLAASGSTVVVPANAADVGGMVAQAMAMYRATAGTLPAGMAGAASAAGSTGGIDGAPGVGAPATPFAVGGTSPPPPFGQSQPPPAA